MQHFQHILAAMLLILATIAPAHSVPAPLPDQNGTPIDFMSLNNGLPVVAIVASGRKLRHIKGWEEGLRKDFPDMISVRVADITDDPRPTQEQVAEKLRKRAPEGISIIIDLDNVWATEYQLDTKEPCVLLLAPTGELIAKFRGRASKARLAEVSAALSEIFVAPEDATDNRP